MGCDIHPYAEVRRNGKWERVGARLPSDRDYRTFGLLADVRNYTTNPAITPLSEPRGLPEDVAWHDDDPCEDEDGGTCWLGDHSFSYFTLAELRTVDLCAPVTLQGIVSAEAADNYKRYGWEPREWCQGSTDPTKVHLEWTQPLCDACSLLPRLIMTLAKLGPPEDVRMVFGFDN